MTIDDIDNSEDHAQAMSASTTRDNAEINGTDADAIRAPHGVTPEAKAAHFAAVAGDADPYLIDGKASVTWRALRYRWPRYARWCEAEGRAELPCEADQFRRFVRFLINEGLAPKSIEGYVSCVSVIATLRGSSADRSLIGPYLSAARRRHGPPRRARPARGHDVADILRLLDPTSVRDVRDGLVFALGFALAARSAELVGLDWERPGSIDRGSTGVVQLEASGILVRWHRSKASQAQDVELEIPDADYPEARIWLELWLAVAGVSSGTPLFRGVTKWGTIMPARLTTAAISRVIRPRVEQLEISRGRDPSDARQRATRYSSHSLRRGYCTTAADAGVPLAVIRQRSRHADDSMVARYVGEAEERRHSGLAGLLPHRQQPG